MANPGTASPSSGATGCSLVLAYLPPSSSDTLYERMPHTNSVMIVLKLVSLACVLLQFSGCCVVGLSSSFPVVVAVELHVESETINNEIKLLQQDIYHRDSRSVSRLH